MLEAKPFLVALFLELRTAIAREVFLWIGYSVDEHTS